MVKGENKQRLGWFLTLVIVAIVSFVAGTRSEKIFATVAPIFGVRMSSGSIDLSSVQETYRNLVANYDGKLDTQKLIYGANRGLVEAAGDSHTAYMDPAVVHPEVDHPEFHESLGLRLRHLRDRRVEGDDPDEFFRRHSLSLEAPGLIPAAQHSNSEIPLSGHETALGAAKPDSSATKRGFRDTP